MLSGKLRKESGMHLHRVTPDAFENYNMATERKYLGQAADRFKPSLDGQPSNSVVVAHFDRFGGGKYRKSDYEVIVEWEDVEEIVAKFCEAKHPKALAFQEATKLLSALKQMGWSEP
jgi:hypothetical protein